MNRGLWLSTLAIALLTGPAKSFAEAASSCLPGFTALQTIESADPQSPVKWIRPLMNQNDGVTFETKVRWQAETSPDDPHILNTSIQFDPDFEGVSLPYNLYAILIVREGEVLGWFDFTRGCKGVPISFYPGREIRLPPVKLVGDRPQKLQIMVWGRL